MLSNIIDVIRLDGRRRAEASWSTPKQVGFCYNRRDHNGGKTIKHGEHSRLALVLAAAATLASAGRAWASACSVLQPLDDGAINELRSCILAANATPGTAIVFGNGVGHVILNSPLPMITTNTTITGLGQSTSTVDGNGKGRVFDIAPGVTVTISSMTITGGLSDQGGAIRNAGTLTLTDSVVTNNSAVGIAPGFPQGAGPGLGGAIFSPPGSSLTIQRCTFSKNTATGATSSGDPNGVNGAGGGGAGIGGALFLQGSATITDSTFSANVAAGGNGAKERTVARVAAGSAARSIATPRPFQSPT